MHEAALRGGAPDPEAHPGCFLVGAGVIACLALRPTPGFYPAVSLALAGLVLQLPVAGTPHVGSLKPASWLALLRLGIALPLLTGLPAALGARPPWLVLFWLAVFAATGAVRGEAVRPVAGGMKPR